MQELQSSLLFLILFSCVMSDLLSYKIRNGCIIAGLVLCGIMQLSNSGIRGLLHFSLGSFIPIFCLFPLFLFRMIGAGDIKMLAILGGYFGGPAVLKCIVLSFLIAAIFSAAKLLMYHNFKKRIKYFISYFSIFLITKKISPYEQFHDETTHLIHFSIPVFISFALHTGGIY